MFKLRLCFYVFVGNPAMETLHKQAHQRLMMSLRPRTNRAYGGQFKTYIQFCIFADTKNYDNVDILLMFMEFLEFNQISKATIANYVSAIKHNFIIYGLDYHTCSHPKLAMFLKAMSINRPLNLKVQGIIDIPLLKLMVVTCDSLVHPKVYKALYLLAFFAFLRISNLVSSTIQGYDSSRQLSRGDVVWGQPGAHIILKWSKTIQDRLSHQVVQIPSLKAGDICPVTALHIMLSSPVTYIVNKNSPLFADPQTGYTLTEGKVRTHLAQVLNIIGLPPHFITFHSFRRSGVTWAFNHNVQLQHLKVHGGWRSDAIWAYLSHTPQAAGVVAAKFQQILI